MSNTSKTITLVIVSAALGAIAVLLTAPSSGAEVRRKMAKNTKTFGNKITNYKLNRLSKLTNAKKDFMKGWAKNTSNV